MEEIRQEREERRQSGRADRHVAAYLAERDEHPEKRRGREEEAHAHEMRPKEERCPFDEVGWLEEDRMKLPDQVKRREEALLKKDVALREAGGALIEGRSPAEQVVSAIHERERQPAGDNAEQHRAIRRTAPSCRKKGEPWRGDRDRQPCQRGDPKERADHPRCAAPRGDRE